MNSHITSCDSLLALLPPVVLPWRKPHTRNSVFTATFRFLVSAGRALPVTLRATYWLASNTAAIFLMNYWNMLTVQPLWPSSSDAGINACILGLSPNSSTFYTLFPGFLYWKNAPTSILRILFVNKAGLVPFRSVYTSSASHRKCPACTDLGTEYPMLMPHC